jgi:hypothetical protein
VSPCSTSGLTGTQEVPKQEGVPFVWRTNDSNMDIAEPRAGGRSKHEFVPSVDVSFPTSRNVVTEIPRLRPLRVSGLPKRVQEVGIVKGLDDDLDVDDVLRREMRDRC